jgi:hypothetical protein
MKQISIGVKKLQTEMPEMLFATPILPRDLSSTSAKNQQMFWDM